MSGIGKCRQCRYFRRGYKSRNLHREDFGYCKLIGVYWHLPTESFDCEELKGRNYVKYGNKERN